MKVYRKSIFETNSSSSHTLVIHKIDDKLKKIPCNVDNFEICKCVNLPFDTWAISEVDKLRFVVGIIASWLSSYEVERSGYIDGNTYLYDGKKYQEGFEIYKDKILNFNWLVWLCELIKERCNTTLSFPCICRSFPYISDTVSYEDGVLEELDIDRSKLNDKKYMKAYFENLIFNECIILEDRYEEY